MYYLSSYIRLNILYLPVVLFNYFSYLSYLWLITSYLYLIGLSYLPLETLVPMTYYITYPLSYLCRTNYLPLVPVIIYIQDLLSLSMYQPFVSIWILGFYSPVSVVLSFTLFAHRVVTPPLITTRRRHDRSERGTWETKDGPDRRRKRVEKPWGERSEASGA